MANEKNELVLMKVTRRYPRGGNIYGVGAHIRVPEGAAKAMEAANPPFGERIKPPATPAPATTASAGK